MSKVISIDEVKKQFKDGMTLMIGGFLGAGTPEPLIDTLIEMSVQNLTIIANDTSFEDKGLGRLVANNQVKKVIASHVGTNPSTGRLMAEGKMEVVLVPQGTLIEQIRAGGYGLGGILTPTGLGTDVEKGKDIIEVDGKKFILEKPLRADFGLIYGTVSDEFGNVYNEATTKNFNQQIAFACDTVICCAEKVVKPGELDIEKISIPGVVVNYVVDGGK